MQPTYQTDVSSSQLLPGDTVVAYVRRNRVEALAFPEVIRGGTFKEELNLYVYTTDAGELRLEPRITLRVTRQSAGVVHLATRTFVHEKQMSYDDRCWYAHDLTYQGAALTPLMGEAISQRFHEVWHWRDQRWFPKSTWGQGMKLNQVYVIDLGAGKGLVVTEEYHGIGD
jgi:hypothetical protein